MHTNGPIASGGVGFWQDLLHQRTFHQFSGIGRRRARVVGVEGRQGVLS